jgi:hypothetical protein
MKIDCQSNLSIRSYDQSAPLGIKRGAVSDRSDVVAKPHDMMKPKVDLIIDFFEY